MKSLLLAAGLGTRLKPITNTIPKCLVPFGGKPLLEYWLDMLSSAGVNEFYINLFYHADAVKNFINQSQYKNQVTFLEESELLGTGGTLKKNADLFSHQDFFLAHADNLCLTNFQNFIHAHHGRPQNIAMTMMTFTPPDPRTCGVVELDDQNIVHNFYEKVETPPTNLANGAVFVMTPEVAQYAKHHPEIHFEISLEIIPKFVGRILAWHNNDYHLDVGNPETYQKAQDENEIIQKLYQGFRF